MKADVKSAREIFVSHTEALRLVGIKGMREFGSALRGPDSPFHAMKRNACKFKGAERKIRKIEKRAKNPDDLNHDAEYCGLAASRAKLGCACVYSVAEVISYVGPEKDLGGAICSKMPL